MNSKHSFN